MADADWMNNKLVLAGGAAGILLLGLAGGAVMFGGNSGGESDVADVVLPDVTMEDAEEAYGLTDYARVAEILTQLGDANNPLALYRLALMYREGQGVEQSDERAVELLERAVNLDYVDAIEPLTDYYLSSGEQAETLEDGVAWYRRAAALGRVEAIAIMGSYYWTGTAVDQDVARGIEMMTTAADAGDPRAQTNLGYAYARGEGVEQNSETSFGWYLQAAENGLVRAQASVGLFYETGVGTEVNIPEAIRWYLNAYEAGAPGVGSRLGGLVVSGVLENGQDEYKTLWVSEAAQGGSSEAMDWLNARVDEDDAQALTIMAIFNRDGVSMPQNTATANALFLRAAEAGSSEAQMEAARIYATGDGVEQDYIQAHMWANLAAAAGVENAARERAVFAQFLDADQLADAQSRASEWRGANSD
jgi:TPR repeat protein